MATGRNIEMTCSSFNIRCIGKICLSTTALPFYVQDLRFWHFREACREHHLLESKGVVGRTLSSHGSCFCGDVTKLEEDEYALVHNARMSGLTSCFAIYLHSHEHDDSYVLEFFLPVDMKEDADLHNLVQKVKMHVGASFKLGDLLSTEVIRMPMELSKLALTKQLQSIQTSMSREIMRIDSKDSHTVGETNAQIDCTNAQDQCDFGQDSNKNKSNALTMNPGCLSREIMQIDSEDSQTVGETSVQIHYINSQDKHACTNGYPNNWNSVITNTAEMFVDDVTSKNNDVVTIERGYDLGEKGAFWRQGIKTDSLTSEHIQNHFGKSIGQMSLSLAPLSREIVQKDSKDSETVREINPQITCFNSLDQRVPGSGHHNNWSSAISNTQKKDVCNVISKKTDEVTAEKGYNSGEPSASTKRRRKRKLDSITPETIQEHFGKPIGEASRRLGGKHFIFVLYICLLL